MALSKVSERAKTLLNGRCCTKRQEAAGMITLADWELRLAVEVGFFAQGKRHRLLAAEEKRPQHVLRTLPQR